MSCSRCFRRKKESSESRVPSTEQNQKSATRQRNFPVLATRYSVLLLLPRADGREAQAAGGLLAGAFGAVDEVGAAGGNVGCFRQGRGQSTVRAADLGAFLQDDRDALVDGRRDRMESVGHLPQNLAVGDLLNIFFREAGDLLVAIQDYAEPVAAAAFLEEGVNASGAPQRNHVGLRDHEHSV